MSEPIRVGQIVGTHGLKGHVKVEPLTDFVERMEVGHRLRVKNDWVEVLDCKWHKGRPLLLLSGYQNIDKAETLK